MNKFYSGIGSRQCPQEICKLFMNISEVLEDKGYILRSGGAEGADTAFEAGVKEAFRKEIYLPWKGFNNNNSLLFLPDRPNQGSLIGIKARDNATELASKVHPAWDKLSQGAKKLHSRNMMQVLGKDLNTPVDFVLCWTSTGTATGGTASAINLALKNRIPVVNFYDEDAAEQLEKILDKIH